MGGRKAIGIPGRIDRNPQAALTANEHGLRIAELQSRISDAQAAAVSTANAHEERVTDLRAAAVAAEEVHDKRVAELQSRIASLDAARIAAETALGAAHDDTIRAVARADMLAEQLAVARVMIGGHQVGTVPPAGRA